ncbi:MAG TPA: rubrerythrin family protein [Elusimicrobiales bacterium]|nr:rubrerythrin family protein [Elusimicrobiales bacterium]
MFKRSLFAIAALAVLAGSAPAAEQKEAAKTPAAAAVKKEAVKAPEATTLENLQTAFNGESNAKARYEAFAAKAQTEGYLGAAGLFKAAALAESIHAAKHGKAIEALGGVPAADVKTPVVKTTLANLKEALKGENHENKKMYPAFVKKAEADKNMQAVYSFKGAMAAEAMHAQMFSQAIANLKDWKAKKKFLVCQTCGYTTMDLALKTCPVCSQPRSQFTEIE